MNALTPAAFLANLLDGIPEIVEPVRLRPDVSNTGPAVFLKFVHRAGETFQTNWSFSGMAPFRRETADILKTRVADSHAWFTAITEGTALRSVELHATAPTGGVLLLSPTASRDAELAALSAALEAPSVLDEDRLWDRDTKGSILLRLEIYRTSSLTTFRSYARARLIGDLGADLGDWPLDWSFEDRTRCLFDAWRLRHETWLLNVGTLGFESIIEQPTRSSHRRMAAVAALRHFGIAPS
jgi:hypothetical protein